MKRAVVTGGAGLIGTGVIQALLDDGWTVASFDIEETTTSARHILCDVGNETSVLAAFDQLGWKGLELLVNNAGIASPVTGPIHEVSLADWRKVTDSHLTGAFLMTRSAVPMMSEGASIVNMVSTRAFMSEPETEAYAASKGGLVAFTHALAVSLGPKIRVNAIAPGWVTDETDLRKKDNAQHPVGRVGRPKDIADGVLYLASAGFMTGQVLVLDGGMTRKMIYEE
ncbi:NAD(P)-dependent dehydrogenase (short-subunit alcohol dehydrogenase family) [Agrobacterium larrymoorei]|uniref:NAD(P)-dependent dehydrogenase (Short-subunit alcohol dehydrogenase family) n=1 Tax=Agrobacterium larrymoorei TaxID=160699 RepID=A0AAJ2BBB4_9HYPH|nr:SDR family oxidoreductase [Agrobacterium larrymoorei]MDR6102524.1 NAD(P)-dependent dehydrogenase (short-subunit alcohol dehydrogenase family) [Agrobacterium larrymoorei]